MFLAVLVALPVVAPASAVEPSAPPAAEPTPTPEPLSTPQPTASPEPTPSPDPAANPDPAATPDPAPSADPAATPDPAPSAEPSPSPTTAPVIPDAAGHYIVMLRNGTDTAAAVTRARTRNGVKADRSYTRTIRGFAAKLDGSQRSKLLADPNVVAVVPDGVVQLTAQTVPTGVARVGGRLSDVAAIDGTDHRVDADVAIVDTGIAYHPDLNVAGGYNCSTADPTAWRDKNHHGTHVAGTVAALDNSIGVVGVAPGARVWGVKILNDDGYGLISWYVCGLDWILAQHDPVDPSRPLFEAVNMSVTKPGSDDHNCGSTNNDPLHQAICRVVAGGITVVAAAANDSHNAANNIPASYDEVITVSALADTDGKPGGLGGHACYSWGSYDWDDTFANFSNYGADVDLIAPGKCILSTVPGGYGTLSGTSMAAPAVTGAVALYKASRPNATPAEVREALRYLGNMGWAYWTEPDPTHEPLLDVSRISSLGTFDFAPAGPTVQTVETGTTASIPITLTRSATFFERVQLSISSLPAGWIGGPAPASLLGWNANSGRLVVAIPAGTPLGRYDIGVRATNQGRTATTTVTVQVVEDDPTAQPPTASLRMGSKMMLNAVWADIAWPAASDPSSGIGGYELQTSYNGGPWGPSVQLGATQTSTIAVAGFGATYRFRVRAVDAAGHWSPWVEGAQAFVARVFDDRSAAIGRSAGWARASVGSAYRSTETGSSRAGASLTMAFTGHGVGVVAPRGTKRGSAKVYIDGVYIRTIFLWSSTTASRQFVFTRSFPGGGSHRITLRVVGGGRHPLFRLDAFVVSN